MESMEEPVDMIRESSRAALMVNRRVHRDEETDVRRHIVSETVTPADIADIANRLKSKSAVSATELRTLKNSILDNPHNIEVVLNNHGAVRGLVRELTGQDARRQSEAAGCLCNLSLGDGRACAALARAAGPYLLTALHTLNKDLALTCAWAVANAAGGGPQAAELLTSQGAAPALAKLVTSPHRDVSAAALDALIQLACQMGDDFRKEEASHILQTIPQKPFTESSLKLLFVLSCHDDFNDIIDEELLQKLLEHTTKCMENMTESNLEFLYTIRTYANITLNDDVYNVFVGHFSLKLDVLKKVLTMNDVVVQSMLWFLGNLFNYNCKNEFFNALLS